jgi:hypothetical protein
MQLTPLEKYVKFPRLPEANFELGWWYEIRHQFSAAFSFYLRASEFCEETGLSSPTNLKIAYNSLCRAFVCMSRHPGRDITCESILRYAISIAPDRPEAYFLLSKIHAKRQNWTEVYMLSKIGYALETPEDLCKSLGYSAPGNFLLLMAISAYEWGRTIESRKILQELADNHQDFLNQKEVDTLDYYLKAWGVGPPNVADVPYISGVDAEAFKFKFKGIENIDRNYSQAYQDMFILAALDGKEDGTYLEIGSEDPVYKSNTYLLESKFNWKGISVEIDAPEAKKFTEQRSNPVICADATKLNYNKILRNANFDNIIDYLQIDTEPSSTSFEVLTSIPFESYKFRVITFEHDHAVDSSRTYREKSRRYLRSLGYELIVPDIGPTDWYSFEDWWVEPSLVDMERLKSLGMVVLSTPETGANYVKDYFLV